MGNIVLANVCDNICMSVYAQGLLWCLIFLKRRNLTRVYWTISRHHQDIIFWFSRFSQRP